MVHNLCIDSSEDILEEMDEEEKIDDLPATLSDADTSVKKVCTTPGPCCVVAYFNSQ